MAQLQQAAAAMVAESRGHCSEATLQFARAGSWGKFPGNIERDIMRSLQLPLETWPYSWGTIITEAVCLSTGTSTGFWV